MANPWMPGLRHDPGLNAGYNAGTNRMRMVVDHWTAGVNSYGICKNQGLCQFLLPKQGVPWQFAEVNAKCWHAGSSSYGDYNGDGPGIEVERLGGHEPLTPDQIDGLSGINAWLESEWGIPNVHYWGPQFPWHGADFHGHVNHAQIHPNSDGISPEEWALLGTGSGELAPPVTLNREAIDTMWVAYLSYINWVDVYYHGVQVDSFENAGPHNIFGIGPALEGLMTAGITVTTFTDRNEYEGKDRVRDQVTAASRYALDQLH